MRNLYNIASLMMVHIPLGHALRDGIEAAMKDAMYTAPEGMGKHWNAVYIAMVNTIGIPQHDWEYKVCSIFSGRSVKEIKEEFNGI